MQLAKQTSTPDELESNEAVKNAVQALIDKEAIRDLAALYCILRDDNDMEPLLQTFALGGIFISRGRHITGHDALREWYRGTMRANRFSHHIPHAHVIDLKSATKATGVVTGSVEYGDGTRFQLGAYRWYDEYEKIDGRWVFTLRHHKWMFSAPVDELMTIGRDAQRVHLAEGQAIDAELLAPAP